MAGWVSVNTLAADRSMSSSPRVNGKSRTITHWSGQPFLPQHQAATVARRGRGARHGWARSGNDT